jgi:uncharacterized protein (DUF2147 family)
MRFRTPVPALTALLLLAGLHCRARESEAAAAATAMPAATETPSPEKVVGRWLRSDSDYTIQIAGVGPDGKLDVRYFNPNPIHVSRAETRTADGKRLVFVELQDRGYPGNFYALIYDPGSDSLTGVYNHLGQQQQYEVAFSRIEPAP